jgi:hypothetical protein
MRTGFTCIATLVVAAAGCVEISGPPDADGPVPYPHVESILSCQEGGICGSRSGDGPGLELSGVTPELCTAADALDRDGDGFAEECEVQIASAFRPRLSFDPAEAHHSREPYWAALYAVADGVSTLSVMYLLAYHQDAGSGPLGSGAHRGDSEFLIVDVVWAGSAWKLDRVFMSAHWRSLDGLTDRSDTYDWWELYYADVERGRPLVVVSLSKHANYNSESRCTLSVEAGCHRAGSLADVEVLPYRNLGSSAVPLVDCVPSMTPEMYPGTECFWTKRYFDGWQAVSDSTPGYRAGLSFFEARFGDNIDPEESR